MKPLFEKVAILGLGLIGGSLAMDLKQKKLARRVVGYNRSASARRLARARHACDEVFADPAQAVRGADLVVLATPVRHIPRLAQAIRGALEAQVLVTDVGSTKEFLLRQLDQALPPAIRRLGGHPIAGTEQSGMKAAQLGLFKGRWWILTPRNSQEKKSAQKLAALLRALGAKPRIMSPRDHDQALAYLSHLPHMLAFSAMHSVLSSSQNRQFNLAGSSFRDLTRVAASSSEMWRDIVIENREALLSSMRSFEKQWKRLKTKISKRDASALQSFFEAAARSRRKM